ncbi:hypothetical protein MPNT_90072 [Candidatus Methylacidithermus pantelleriae]|uniref:Uncharacterized protein n=1 Tax=Candidatus Methylacidithermus pantelleriae TaxID=2744239 RepID=A0A8J2FU01_9BACT|nr:hypothetical protein MPNT_90072 [Candidatus Methylacidithermus pantelleriae]
MGRLVEYASQKGWAVTKAVSEIGPGVNGVRPKLLRLLSDLGERHRRRTSRSALAFRL